MLNFLKGELYKANRFMRTRIPFVAALLAACIGAVALLGHSVYTVKISDGTKTFTVHSLNRNVETAMLSAGLDTKAYKILETSVGKKQTHVLVGKTFPVYVTVGNETKEVFAVKSTVGEILATLGIEIDEFDMVEPSADTLVSKTGYIDYTDINYVTGSYTEPIPCDTVKVYSSDRDAGTSTVEKGKDGMQLVEYTSKLVNGVAVETVVNNIVTLSNAVSGKQIIGTAAASSQKKGDVVKTSDTVSCVSTLTPSQPIGLDAGGNPVNYKKKMTVQATAYTYTGKNCAIGVAPQPGYIAVNPKIIPYGTKMYIKSSDGRYIYGYAVAADTGGFTRTRPNNVDLFFSSRSACNAFGRRNVEIFILE